MEVKVESKNVVKVEMVGAGSSSETLPIKFEKLELQGLEDSYKKCSVFKKICFELLHLKKAVNEVEAENKGLILDLESKGKLLKLFQRKELSVKKEDKLLRSKISLAEEVNCYYRKEVNISRKKFQREDLSLKVRKSQLNQMKNEYRKLKLAYSGERLNGSQSVPGNLSLLLRSNLNARRSTSNKLASGKRTARSSPQNYNQMILNEKETYKSSQSTFPMANSFRQRSQTAEHKSPQVKDIKCPECFKTFSRPCDMANHRRFHAMDKNRNNVDDKVQPSSNKTLKCPVCLKMFLRPCGLASHQRLHAKEKCAMAEDNIVL